MTNRFEKLIVYFILLIGILLPLVQFFYNRSLCGDEVWLALNIIDRDYSGLLKPLDYVQSAPILFLLIEKTFSLLIPHSELGLKIFPLICYFLSLFYFLKVLKIHLKDHYSIVFALSLFIFNVFIIRYSNEVKQYMSDLLVLVFLYYLSLREYSKPQQKYYYLAFTGMVSIFLSNASITILLVVGLYLLYDNYKHKKRQILFIIPVFVVWLLSFGAYYFLFINNNPVKDEMVALWTDYFMPMNPFKSEFYIFIWKKWQWILLVLFEYGLKGDLLIVFFVLGVIYMIKKRNMVLLIFTLTPIIVQFLLSGLKLYPVVPRTFLFLLPVIVIVCSSGVNFLTDITQRYVKIKQFNIFSVVIPVLMIVYFGFLIYVNGYPVRRNEVKSTIKYIENNIAVNDQIYVTYNSTWVYEYYQKISFMDIKNETILGTGEYKNSTSGYYHELDSLKGKVWFLFVDFGDNNHENRDMVVSYMDSKNIKPINQYAAPGSYVYSYDIRE